ASLLALTLGVTTTAIVARGVIRAYQQHGRQDFWKHVSKYLGPPSSSSSSSSSTPFQFYKGGFQSTMDKKEASLILGLSPTLRWTHLTPSQLKDQHRKIMVLNHPDKGGSPYLASKINEAKSILEKYTES
ncbi:DnaJ sub C member 15, partial [Coelomomyces lativittatus]